MTSDGVRPTCVTAPSAHPSTIRDLNAKGWTTSAPPRPPLCCPRSSEDNLQQRAFGRPVLGTPWFCYVLRVSTGDEGSASAGLQ